MTATRHWNGGVLALAWVATFAALALLRLLLQAGIYRAALEDGAIRRLGGVWPASFAAVATLAAAVVGLVFMGWVTWDWFAGRQERETWRLAREADHRRVLM